MARSGRGFLPRNPRLGAARQRVSSRRRCGYRLDVTTAQQARARTYPATFAMFAALALAAFLIMFMVLLLVIHPKHGAPETLPDQVLGAAGIAAFLSLFVQLAQCRVNATSSALIVVHPIRRYVLPWSQIADVVVGRDGGLRIQLRDRRSFAVFCFGGSVLGMITGGLRAKKARDGIKAVMTASTANQGTDGEPVTSSLYLQWKIALAMWGALTAASVGGWLLAPHHVLA
jgi:Bacterial PH domain